MDAPAHCSLTVAVRITRRFLTLDNAWRHQGAPVAVRITADTLDIALRRKGQAEVGRYISR